MIENAVAIVSELAAARPDAFRPHLAMYLSNLSGRLSRLGRPDDALAAIEEAVALRRDLDATQSDVFGADLARCLDNLSSRLSKLGRPEEAFAAIEEGVATLREPFLARPVAYVRQMATMIRHYRQRCKDARRSPNTSLLTPIDDALRRLDTQPTNDRRGATDE